MVFCCARETGWPEPFIRWELPLARLLQYEQIRLIGLDFRCYPAGSTENARSDFQARVATETEAWERECDTDNNPDSWLAPTPDA